MLKIIMIFESADFILSSLASDLKKLGYTIFEVSSCKAALNIIKEIDISLFIIDIDIPDNDRMDFFNALNNNKVSLHVPVIMVSGKYNCIIKEAYDGTGVKSWMIRAFDEIKFPGIIKNLMDMP